MAEPDEPPMWVLDGIPKLRRAGIGPAADSAAPARSERATARQPPWRLPRRPPEMTLRAGLNHLRELGSDSTDPVVKAAHAFATKVADATGIDHADVVATLSDRDLPNERTLATAKDMLDNSSASPNTARDILDIEARMELADAEKAVMLFEVGMGVEPSNRLTPSGEREFQQRTQPGTGAHRSKDGRAQS
jgi:hypothetical protein